MGTAPCHSSVRLSIQAADVLRAAALTRCIMVRELKEAAAPEFEEFEVSAKSSLHQGSASLSVL